MSIIDQILSAGGANQPANLFDFSVLADRPTKPAEPAPAGPSAGFHVVAVIDPRYPEPAWDPWLSARERRQILDDIAWFDRMDARLNHQSSEPNDETEELQAER